MATALSYRNKGLDSSDSDSEDSDKECHNWKRVTKNDDEDLEKIPITPSPANPPEPMPAPNNLKRKRNTIWCEVLEDQMMSDTLKFCGIKNKPKGFGSRGEESYDFTIGKKAYSDDGSDEHMSDDSRTHYPKRHKRFKMDNYVEIDPEGKEVAKKIIRVLAEQKSFLIYRVVKYLGTEKALNLLKMTEDIEENGGMMIKSNQRRRTPGGVYLHLLRSDKSIEKDIMDKIFEGELNHFENKKKFDELRKLKKRRKGKKKKKAKDKMEVEHSSPEKGSDNGAEEDGNKATNAIPNAVDIPTPVAVDISDAIASERISDLEEGEVE